MKPTTLITSFSYATAMALSIGSQGSSSHNAVGRNLPQTSETESPAERGIYSGMSNDKVAKLRKRAVKRDDCGRLDEAIRSCVKRANTAAAIISNSLTGRNKELYDQYFKGNDPKIDVDLWGIEANPQVRPAAICKNLRIPGLPPTAICKNSRIPGLSPTTLVSSLHGGAPRLPDGNSYKAGGYAEPVRLEPEDAIGILNSKRRQDVVCIFLFLP
ncbi:uncharacterized protein MAM_08425 [Metarhizium album ARSEF 1941]|uniref:Uncharacterized protein n=1 Tax=Metarhizium album (strain ARSEF 1941) TaxID=1081103 RepID=A0A0B2WJ58_METAS|nr:uncharacterized protein MAM_08425 [Metarhizium album ARSEF 1941]KHN93719.1 hypothetical protein MAM_08425 [Metarhizium album ARSEF 1941]